MFKQTDLHRLTDMHSFLALSDRDFEYCCKFLLEEAGYGKAFVTKKGVLGGDGGIDLDIYSPDRKLQACAQCKLWKGRYKGLMKPVRELCGSMKIKGVERGIFIITVDATPAEKREAELQNIEMIDSPALLRLVKQCASQSPVVMKETEKVTNYVEKKELHGSSVFVKDLLQASFAVLGIVIKGICYAALRIVMIVGFLLDMAMKELARNDSNYRSRRKHYRRYRRKNGYGF